MFYQYDVYYSKFTMHLSCIYRAYDNPQFPPTNVKIL